MQKWEYLFFCETPNGHTINGEGVPIEEVSNFYDYVDELGLEGWELVGTQRFEGIGYWSLAFKRPFTETSN